MFVGVLIVNPFLGLQLAVILQTLFMAVKFSIPYRKIPNTPAGIFFSAVIKTFMLIYGIFGVLILDTAVMWLAGALTYSDWRYHLPSIILIIYTGFGWVYYGVVRARNPADILYLLCGSAVILYYIHIFVAQFPVMGPVAENLGKILGYVFAFAPLTAGADLYLLLRRRIKKSGEPSDFSEKVNGILNGFRITPPVFIQKIYDKIPVAVVYCLLLLQAMLTLNGYSLLG